jgi:RNA polymerase primary sigma factor
MPSSLTIYLRDISRVPLLAEKEELELARLCRFGDEGARAKLIQSNLRLVVSVAKQYQGKGLPLEELVSAGHEGLLQAVARFQHTRGCRFSTYAVWWIRCYVLRPFTTVDLIALPTGKLEAIRQVNAAVEILLQAGKSPTTRAVAHATRMTQKQVALLWDCRPTGYVSLDAPVPEGGLSPADTIPSTDPSFEEILERDIKRKRIRAAIKQLAPREAEVVACYYGIGCPEQGLQMIATRKRLTPERVRQLRDRGVKQLKSLLSKE